MDYDLAKWSVDKAREYLDHDEAEAIADFIKLFEPYKGDDANEARSRQPMTGHCSNCGYEMAIMFYPALLERAALAGIRLAQCPRCFSTEMMCGSATAPAPESA